MPLKEQIEQLQQTKLTTTELRSHLPTNEEQEAHITTLIHSSQHKFIAEVHEQIVQLDNKIVSIRKQFDPNKVERMIKQKADKIDLMTKFDDHD